MQPVRKNLEDRCRNCEWCHGEGMVTVFHDLYDGQPYQDIKDGTGRIHREPRRVSPPCVCPLGFWIAEGRRQEATTVRELDASRVIDGSATGWSLKDPTLPYFDESEVPQPGALRAMMAKISGVAKVPDRVRRDENARARENMLVRFLVAALDPGPATFDDIVVWCKRNKFGGPDDLRVAAELARLKIQTIDGQETWSLE